jgi:hypothetical protein
MQTLMEFIETCINKEPNANPSDVSPNASPSVLTVEAITKAPVSATALDVREANDSQSKKSKVNNFVALQNLRAQKIMVALCL